jgi:transposase-like protein
MQQVTKILAWLTNLPADKWFLDEVFLRIGGKLQYLSRAVDRDGNVLDIVVPSRRKTKAARRVSSKLMAAGVAFEVATKPRVADGTISEVSDAAPI